MSRRRRYPSLPCIPRWSAPGSHPRPTPPRRKNRPVAAATHSAALHSPPPSGSPRRRARISGKSRPPWSGPVSAAPPAHPGMLRRCAATRCLPDTSLPSTRCRRCSTRDPTRDTADAASAHPPARRWPRSDPSAAPPDASPQDRPPPSPASACPSHSACYSPTTSAPTVPSNAALQADARFAAAIPHVLARIIVHPKCLLFRQDSANSFSHGTGTFRVLPLLFHYRYFLNRAYSGTRSLSD